MTFTMKSRCFWTFGQSVGGVVIEAEENVIEAGESLSNH